jgi:hypothetical protein
MLMLFEEKKLIFMINTLKYKLANIPFENENNDASEETELKIFSPINNDRYGKK